MSTLWEITRGGVSVPPNQDVYVVCRSRSIADRWTIRNQISKHKANHVSSIEHLRGIKRDSVIFVIFLEDDSVYFREDIAREKIHWDNLTIVRL